MECFAPLTPPLTNCGPWCLSEHGVVLCFHTLGDLSHELKIFFVPFVCIINFLPHGLHLGNNAHLGIFPVCYMTLGKQKIDCEYLLMG